MLDTNASVNGRLGWDDDCLGCNGLVYEFFQIKMATESVSLVVSISESVSDDF